MIKNISIEDLQKIMKGKSKEEVGKILSGEESGNWCGIWYDWFCEGDELEKRAQFFQKYIEGLSGEWTKNHYVWLKNNCPMVGDLYDDIRISPFDDSEGSYNILFINRPDSDEHLSIIDTRVKTPEGDLSSKGFDNQDDAIQYVNQIMK